MPPGDLSSHFTVVIYLIENSWLIVFISYYPLDVTCKQRMLYIILYHVLKIATFKKTVKSLSNSQRNSRTFRHQNWFSD